MQPSFKTGYAKNASESANPQLWEGLVGAWMPSFGVTGGTLRDVSGNHNNGTLNNMDPATDWVVHRSKQAIALYDNQIIDCGSKVTDTIRGTENKFTLSCYVNRQQHFQIGAYSQGDGQGFFLQWFTTTLYYGATSTGNYYAYKAYDVFNEWTHLAFVYDGDRRLFINGKEQTQDGENGSATGVGTLEIPFYIGSFYLYNIWSRASVSAAMLHNRALSPREIEQLYVDPLAAFKRKQRRIYSVPGPAFKAAWATRSTTIAGVPSGA